MCLANLFKWLRHHSIWSTLTTSYHKAVPKMLRCVNLSITLKGIDGIIIRFWETAHLPLPWDNVNTYFSLRAKCWLRGGVGIMIPINYREPARNKNSELWGRMPLPLSHMRLWWARVFFSVTYEWRTNCIVSPPETFITDLFSPLTQVFTFQNVSNCLG